jgi:hypothetical protein
MTDALPAPAQKSAYERLPRRRRRFVDQYVTGLTSAEAIRAIGCKSPHARSIANKWLRDPDVAEAVDQRTREAMADAGVRQMRAMQELYAIATSDPRKVVSKDGKPLSLHELPDDIAACISSVDVEDISINGETGVRYKYRFWDKVKALDKLGQYLKLWDVPKPHNLSIDARSVTVHSNGGGEAVLRAVDELLARAARAGQPATDSAADSNGPVLPAAVRDGASGHRSPVDAGADSGSPE